MFKLRYPYLQTLQLRFNLFTRKILVSGMDLTILKRRGVVIHDIKVEAGVPTIYSNSKALIVKKEVGGLNSQNRPPFIGPARRLYHGCFTEKPLVAYILVVYYL